jgi:hypothetical protein
VDEVGDQMILTTIRLNPEHVAARVEWRDLCRMHARVIDATVGMGEGPRVLWAQPLPWTLVVRAPEPVTAVRLPARYAVDLVHRPWTPPKEGQHRAVMVVNPVRQKTEIREDGSRRNVRRVIRDSAAQVAWVRDLLTPMIDQLQLRITDQHVRHGWHRDGNRITHTLTTVQLTGEVTDHQQLAEIATRGLGRARSYGGGLSIWEKQ